MPQPLAHARIPQEWEAQLKAIAQETGQSYSDVVRAAIAQYLGRTDLESVESMSKRMAALERQVKKLAQLVTSS
jgi:predicted DNA-binding protein